MFWAGKTDKPNIIMTNTAIIFLFIIELIYYLKQSHLKLSDIINSSFVTKCVLDYQASLMESSPAFAQEVQEAADKVAPLFTKLVTESIKAFKL